MEITPKCMTNMYSTVGYKRRYDGIYMITWWKGNGA